MQRLDNEQERKADMGSVAYTAFEFPFTGTTTVYRKVGVKTQGCLIPHLISTAIHLQDESTVLERCSTGDFLVGLGDSDKTTVGRPTALHKYSAVMLVKVLLTVSCGLPGSCQVDREGFLCWETWTGEDGHHVGSFG